MKKFLLLTVLALFCCGSVFAQENKTDKKGKKKQKTEVVNDGESPAENTPVVNEDSDDDDLDSGGGQYVPSLLHSSQDVYTNNTSYTFNIAYFRMRGYDNRYQGVFANGFEMNNMGTCQFLAMGRVEPYLPLSGECQRVEHGDLRFR